MSALSHYAFMSMYKIKLNEYLLTMKIHYSMSQECRVITCFLI